MLIFDMAEGVHAVSWTMYEFLNFLVHRFAGLKFLFYEDFIKH